jgi:hypothetical protein
MTLIKNFYHSVLVSTNARIIYSLTNVSQRPNRVLFSQNAKQVLCPFPIHAGRGSPLTASFFKRPQTSQGGVEVDGFAENITRESIAGTVSLEGARDTILGRNCLHSLSKCRASRSARLCWSEERALRERPAMMRDITHITPR